MKPRCCRYTDRGPSADHRDRGGRLAGSVLPSSVLLLIGLVFLAASAAGAQPQTTRSKVLLLGVRADAPPFASFDQEREKPQAAAGYTVDLCKRIAERAVREGLYCSYKPVAINAADRFSALTDGRIQLLCGATTVTLERMRAADFSLFTFLSGASVMYRRPHDRPADQQSAPLRVGVLGNTTSEDRAKQILHDHQLKNDNFGYPKPREVEVKAVDDHFVGLAQLKAGTIDAYVADREILLALRQRDIEKNKKTDIVVSDDYYTIEPYAIGIERGNFELRYIADMVLSELYGWDRPGNRGENIFTVLWNNFPRKRFSKSLEALFRFQRISRGQPILDPAQPAECP